MTTCPCCSNAMVRHIRHQQVSWFCRHCWQEMPVLEQPGLNLGSPNPEASLMPPLRRTLVTL